MRGDKDAAEKAFLETIRTVAVLVAGAAGFCMAGPPLAVFCSVGVGVQWNLGMIVPINGKQKHGICHVIDDPFSLDTWIDGVVGVASDGITRWSFSESSRNHYTFFRLTLYLKKKKPLNF